MLRQGQQFHMRKVVFLQIGDQFLCKLPVVEPSKVFLLIWVMGLLPPGATVKLINIHGNVVPNVPLVHPDGVRKLEFIQPVYNACCFRAQFHLHPVWIRLVHDSAVRLLNPELVHIPRCRPRCIQSIKAGKIIIHGDRLPAIVTAYEPDPSCLWCINPKLTAVLVGMCTEKAVGSCGMPLQIIVNHKLPPNKKSRVQYIPCFPMCEIIPLHRRVLRRQ